MAKLYTLQDYIQNASKEFSGVNWDHYFSKAFDQLRGLCHGMLCDGQVSDAEAEYLRAWLLKNHPVTKVWPFSDIASRVSEIFADGIISDEERRELQAIMETVIDGKGIPTAGAHETAWEVVFTKPSPDVVEFSERNFSLTGKFAFGSRSKIVKQIEALGGEFHDNPIMGTHYLVIGEFGSPNWKNSNYGNKIEKAMKLTKSGDWPVLIVREALFRQSIS